jgi:NADPH:quinone reductase-like Zn-dependent oxidoreductase
MVRVRAAAVNYPDVLIIEDKYQFKPPRPFAPGGEIAGEVEAIGEGVEGWKAGDRLIAVPGWGGMAEKVVIPAKSAIPLPDGTSFTDGAALLLTYATSIHALYDRGRLEAGQTLLVLGAAGGVGLAAVELGRARGRTGRRRGFLRGKGGCSARCRGGPGDRLSARTVRQGRAESACPAVQGRSRDPMAQMSSTIRSAATMPSRHCGPSLGGTLPGGRIPGRNPQAAAKPHPAQKLRRVRRVLGCVRGARSRGQRGTCRRACFRLWDEGKIRPRVSATYPLDRGGEAIAAMAARQVIGKLVVTLD